MSGMDLGLTRRTVSGAADWWSFKYPGATMALDYCRDLYMIEGANIPPALINDYTPCARTSGGNAQTSTGLLINFAADTLRRTDQGLLVEISRTNKSTNYNANPTDFTNMADSGAAGAVFSVVDDSAEIAAAGLGNVCTTGNIFKIDNSGGAGDAWLGSTATVGNTNSHSLSAYIRGGTGKITIGSAGSPLAFAASAGYTKIKNENVSPALTSDAMLVHADPGEIVYFTLNQLEEAAFSSSVIVTAGSATTRNADVVTLNDMGWFMQGVGTLLCEAVPEKVGDNPVFWEISDDTPPNPDNKLTVFLQGASPRFQMDVEDAAVAIHGGFTPPVVPGDTVKTIWAWQDDDSQPCVDGTLATQVVSLGVPANLSQMRVGAGVWRSGAYHFSGRIMRLVYWPERKSDTELQALTA